MATDEEYRARCVLQAKINELEDRLEQSNAQLEQWRAVLDDISDGNADGCPDCAYNQRIARAALTKGSAPSKSQQKRLNVQQGRPMMDKDADSRRAYGCLRFLPDDQGYEYVGEVVVEDRDSPSWAASLDESDKDIALTHPHTGGLDSPCGTCGRSIQDHMTAIPETEQDCVQWIGVDLAKPGSDRTAYRCIYCGHIADSPDEPHRCLTEKNSE